MALGAAGFRVFMSHDRPYVCPFVSHAVSLDVHQYSRVQQKRLSINNPRSHHACTIIVHTAVLQQKTQRRGDSIDALSRMERSTADPTEHVVITCRLRESNFEKSSLAEFGCDARSFAGDREGCCVGGTWRGRAVSGDRVAPGSSRS